MALCLTFAAVMAAILASQILTGYWAVVLMCLMGLGTGVAAPSRDIMIRGATVAKLGKKSFGRVYGFTYCGMDVGQSLTPILFGPLLDVGMFTAVLFGDSSDLCNFYGAPRLDSVKSVGALKKPGCKLVHIAEIQHVFGVFFQAVSNGDSEEANGLMVEIDFFKQRLSCFEDLGFLIKD